MKEKTSDIDILEDLLSTQKQYIEDKDYQKEHNIKEQAIDYAKMWTKATENLIAENKELKEFKENIEKIDRKQLDKLYEDAQKALKEYRETQNKVAKLEEENKELKEEVERQGVARAIEEDYIEKNFINKNEIKEEIQELKNMKIDGEVFKTAVNYAIKILQSLLGKE